MIRTLTALMAVAGKFGISTVTRGKIEISMPLNGDTPEMLIQEMAFS